jgi:hypothetical protein
VDTEYLQNEILCSFSRVDLEGSASINTHCWQFPTARCFLPMHFSIPFFTLCFPWNNENYLRPSKYSIRIYIRDAVQGEDAQVAFTTNNCTDELFRQLELKELTSLSLNSAKLLFV